MYSSYGEKYSTVFTNVAVDILTEEATKYTAYDFFMDRGRIKDDFQVNLNKIFNSICFANIQFLQLRSVDLPNLFEESIQESEVKKQDIQKAMAELNKVRVEVDTRIKSAEFQKDVAIVILKFKIQNAAEGEAGALLKQNEANIVSLNKVQNAQSQAYSNLKGKLKMDNASLLNFIKTKLIKNYNGNDLTLSMASPEK